MQTQNPIKLGNGLRERARSVWARNDQLGLCTIEMGAPVSYDAITAVRAVVLPAVADDRVVRNANSRFVDYRQRRACRLQSCDAVRETFRTSRDLHKVGTSQRVHHGCGKPGWEGNQANSNFSDSITGYVAAAVRSTNKDNTLYPGIRAKGCRANNQTIPGIFFENAPGILPQSFLPHSFIDRNYLVVSQHAAHAVADHDVRLVVGIQLIGLGQFFP